MIVKGDVVRLVSAYLTQRSKHENEIWETDGEIEEFDFGWRVTVRDASADKNESSTCWGFVLLIDKSGRLYRPKLTSVERDMMRLESDPSNMCCIFQLEDLDDE